MSEAQQRKLATIVALDVAGYSALTEADEARATAAVAHIRRCIETIIGKHHGRLFNTAGDGFMLEFGSSAAAVEAAFEIAAACDPKVRVGVHLGDVAVQPNGDLLGHGVNVAARLMAQATPGSALVSADVRRTIRGAIAERLVSRGSFKLDKMSETIEAFALGTGSHGREAAVSSPTTPVLAVLPFDNLSNDAEMDFFSDGVAEDILQLLTRSTALKVVGRTSAFQYRGERKGLAARELKATHILDGAVRKAGTRMRVNAQLTEAAAGTVLWSERYDREIADAFVLQDDVAGHVASALQQTLSLPAPQRIDPLAYELYLKARPLATQWGLEPTRQAVALLEQVVAREPHMAQAWALLAAARAFLLPGTRDAIGEPQHDAALAAANRALALDANCAEGYRALAMLKPAFAAHGEKIRLTQMALSLAPDDPIMLQAAAIAQISVGRGKDSLATIERLLAVDPGSIFQRSTRALGLMDLGRKDEAFAEIEALWRAHPRMAAIWYLRWLMMMFNGRIGEAEAMSATDATLPDLLSAEGAQLMRGVASLMKLGEAERSAALSRLLGPAPVALRLCSLSAYAGHADLAYARLFRALDQSESINPEPSQTASAGIARAYTCADLFHFDAAALRRDVRFVDICARFGLVDYWRESGHWPDCAAEVPYDFKAECENAARA